MPVQGDRLRHVQQTIKLIMAGVAQTRILQAPTAETSYMLLADGKWCQGGAQSAGISASGYSLESCKAVCSVAGSSCSYLSFGSANGWCSTYATCGTPTTTPNGVAQNTAGWSTLVKEEAHSSFTLCRPPSQHLVSFVGLTFRLFKQIPVFVDAHASKAITLSRCQFVFSAAQYHDGGKRLNKMLWVPMIKKQFLRRAEITPQY